MVAAVAAVVVVVVVTPTSAVAVVGWSSYCEVSAVATLVDCDHRHISFRSVPGTQPSYNNIIITWCQSTWNET